jgi:hypothetical protein
MSAIGLGSAVLQLGFGRCRSIEQLEIGIVVWLGVGASGANKLASVCGVDVGRWFERLDNGAEAGEGSGVWFV